MGFFLFYINMITFLKKYLGNIYIPVIWTLTIGILLSLPGSMIPNEQNFDVPNFDKVVHMGLFGGFVFLWNLYVSRRPIPLEKMIRIFFILFVIANMYGIGMEYVQKYWIPNRDFSLGDIIADMGGAGLGYGISNLTLLNTKNKFPV